MYHIRQRSKKILACILGLTLIFSGFSGFNALVATAHEQAPIQPFDNTFELCERRDWVVPGNSNLPRAQSSITLPDRRLTPSERAVWIAEYFEMGGVLDYELEVIRLVNEVRVAYGRNTVQLDRSLALAARFHAQIMATFGVDDNWSHHVGPYGSSTTASVFGAWAVGSWAGNASASSGMRTPESVVQGLLNSPGHCRSLLNPNNRYAGSGVHIGGFMGSAGTSHYLMFTTNPSLARHTTTVSNGTISTALGETTAGEFLSGETVSITANVPSGHRFVRWEGSVTFANATSASTTFVMPASGVTVSAITEPTGTVTTYTITFNANGGVNAPEPQTKTHGAGLTLTSSVPTRDGYRFLGWATTPTATVAEYQPGATFARNGNATLFAVWQRVDEEQTYREVLRELIDEARAIPVPTPQTAAWGRFMSAINAAEITYRNTAAHDLQLIQQINLLRTAINTYLGV